MFILHILLGILKILGVIILAILGLILILALLILFVPIRYNVKVAYRESLKLDITVSYLLRAFVVNYQKGRKNPKELRIFGIKTPFLDEDRKEQKAKKKEEKEVARKEKTENKRKEEEKIQKDTEFLEQLSREREERLAETEDEELDMALPAHKSPKDNGKPDGKSDENTDAKSGGKSDDNLDKKEKKSLFSKIKCRIIHIISKIKYIFHKICDTIKNIRAKIRKMIHFLGLEDTKLAIKSVKKELMNLIRHILPRKISGHLEFGFENPATTGKLYGAMCVFYSKKPRKLDIHADFEKKVLDCDLQVKGYVQIWYIGFILLRLYFNPSVKNTIKNWKKEEL